MFGQKMDVWWYFCDVSMSDGISVLTKNVKIYLWLENTGNTGREELNIAKDLRFGNVKAHMSAEIFFIKENGFCLSTTFSGRQPL